MMSGGGRVEVVIVTPYMGVQNQTRRTCIWKSIVKICNARLDANYD